ncbi:hypothetical protein [Algibacter luteus]|uniref:hypothetical protein n=1 Tax=Algibacter luteus TaxID=1178825 RepID=UPI00259AE699|nr:hypothetical protein [Algibacter luteus]WJJ96355.1 hypothetical protein O5O44_14165 [Algibacter luteus]
MIKKLLWILSFFILINCIQNNRNSSFEVQESQFILLSEGIDKDENRWDGDYCADIEYHNPNTGTYSSYTLTIEVLNNELELINFPNGGYLDDFYSVEFDEDGYAEFTSDRGYDYEVQITGEIRDCFEDVPMAVQCNGITEDGDQCRNLTDNYNGYCWQHEEQE